MALDFRRYETQAKVSLLLGILGLLAAGALWFLLARRFDPSTFYVSYNRSGPLLPVVGAGLLFGLLAAVAGFFIGLNSAGQTQHAFQAVVAEFFLNAFVIAVLLSTAVFFFFARDPRTVVGGP